MIILLNCVLSIAPGVDAEPTRRTTEDENGRESVPQEITPEMTGTIELEMTSKRSLSEETPLSSSVPEPISTMAV